MNKVVKIGRIFSKLRFVQKEYRCYLNFLIRTLGKDKNYECIQVTLTDDLAIKMRKELKEGLVVKVTGKMTRVSWQDKKGKHEMMKIFANEIIAPYTKKLPKGFDFPGWDPEKSEKNARRYGF